MAGIEAGRLKDRVVLLEPQYAKDEFGQDIITWGRHGPVYAEVAGSGGGTALSVGRSSITYSHTVTIRKTSLVNKCEANWRLEWKNRVFEISSVIEQDNCLLALECADERPYSEKPVIEEQDAILWDKEIYDPVGNSKQPHSPINTRRSS